MASKRARQAVSSLVAVLDADLGAALRAIETADSITANSLGSPVDVLPAYVPHDNRSLLVQVFAEAGENLSDFPGHSGISSTDCTITIQYNSTTDVESSEAFMWRWTDAICDVISADPTLGGNVVGARWTDFDRTFSIIDESTTRHIRAIGVEVHTC